MISEWTALIVSIGGLVGVALYRAKEIYEIWTQFTRDWRKEDRQHESIVVEELKTQIDRLKLGEDNLRVMMAFLNQEQLECGIEEERLWGALTLVHRHVAHQAEVIQSLGGRAESPPPIPERRKKEKMSAEEFLRRTLSTTTKMREVMGQPPLTAPSASASTSIKTPPSSAGGGVT